MSIYKKLHEIQKSVRGFGKDKKGHNYTYVSGEKVLGHVRAKMDELGLLLKQEILSIDNDRQDYKTKFGSKAEILSKVMMRFTWVDIETGETDVNLFGANGQNDFDKGVGSALTYAERYFLLKFFHIPTDEDDIDNPNRKKPEEKQKPKSKPKSNTQVKTLESLLLEIESAKSREELTSIWNTNKNEFKENKKFNDALTEAGLKFPK